MSFCIMTCWPSDHPVISNEYLPPEIHVSQLQPLMELVSQIEAAPTGSAEARSLIERFNASTRKNYLERDFREYYSAVDLETFVKGAMLPYPGKFHDVPDAQFLAVLERLRHPDCDEAEQGYWIRFLETNLDCKEITDVIYWSEDNPSDSEILARARARKRTVINLPPRRRLNGSFYQAQRSDTQTSCSQTS